MVEIRALETKQQACEADIVEKLEFLLKEARAGELVGVGIAAVYRDNSIGSIVGRSVDVGRLLGAVTYLSSRILRRMDPE